jgi:predicted DNA-binding transcriptional regulator YafY
MKINRLIEIVIILLNKETVTAKELGERFNVSQRTIYRDIEELSASGIPVYMNKGKGGGISLLENYTLNKAMLSEEEKGNIIFALKTLGATKKVEIDNTLEKLGSIFGSINFIDWIGVDFNPWGVVGNSDKRFEEIKRAILAQKILEFYYVDSKNAKSHRSVKPYKLIFKGQSWYLLGFCCDKEQGRVFKITRMREVKASEITFERKESSDLFNYNYSNPNFTMITLKLRFKADMFYRLIDYYDENQMLKEEENTYLVTAEFPYDQWIYSHILSYGDSVEVVEPQFIKDEIKRRLLSMLEKY